MEKIPVYSYCVAECRHSGGYSVTQCYFGRMQSQAFWSRDKEWAIGMCQALNRNIVGAIAYMVSLDDLDEIGMHKKTIFDCQQIPFVSA